MMIDKTAKNASPIIGLVVCGGNSSRMGRDKSQLIYHGKPQCYYLYDMLESICDQVFISCNQQQAMEINQAYKLIIDLPDFTNIGPMAALLSANSIYPHSNFLMIGCDYPFLTEPVLNKFLDLIKKERSSAAFYNEDEMLYEPLLAYYDAAILEEIKSLHAKKQHSLQYLLKRNNAIKFYPPNKTIIQSVDTYEAYLEAIAEISKSTIAI